jgi:septum site-determining protein MinC
MSVNRIEGGLFTLMTLTVGDLRDPALDAALDEQIARSPHFFSDAPVVLDLKGCIGCLDDADFAALKAMLKRRHLIAVGVQNASVLQRRAAIAADLAPFPATAGKRATPEGNGVNTRTKLVTEPVRSGTQIYARGGDLVVTAAVSAGAELIADGHVHVYGALRGRAIAGARGNIEARIFTQRLEAELVAIAGRYLVSEAIPAENLRRPAQLALVEDRVQIVPGWSGRE